ncbi:Mrp family chromosome partitioning ATPase [Paraburkholderia sp. Clong3]
MAIYAVWNNKGGVGKSYLTFQIACEYARQNPLKKQKLFGGSFYVVTGTDSRRNPSLAARRLRAAILRWCCCSS